MFYVNDWCLEMELFTLHLARHPNFRLWLFCGCMVDEASCHQA